MSTSPIVEAMVQHVGAGKPLPAEKLTDTWRTPRWLVDALAQRVSGFDLDAAADANNAVVRRFIDRAMDALSDVPWAQQGQAPRGREGLHGAPLSIFCNPPFSLLREFVERSVAECAEYGHTIALVTLADISTRYWRLLERPPEGVTAERVAIRGRWSCEPPPGIIASTPTRPMAAWILRPEIVPPRKRIKELDR